MYSATSWRIKNWSYNCVLISKQKYFLNLEFDKEWPHSTIKNHISGDFPGLIVAHPKPVPFSPNVWQSFSTLNWLLIVLCLIGTLLLKTLIYIYYTNVFKVRGKLLFWKCENTFMNMIFHTLFSFTEPIKMNWFQRNTVGK